MTLKNIKNFIACLFILQIIYQLLILFFILKHIFISENY